ncbi:MAG: hypothetical protein JNK78_12455 [Planctomycetes bacterium]|nr:hypothetical protein [Planctomycetota bacterium]
MIPLYLFNNLHAGDQLFSRPLYRALAADPRFLVVLGAYANQAYLFEDLAGQRLTVQRSAYPERGRTVLYDLAADCPDRHFAVSTWLGEYEDTGNHQWRNVVEVCRRQLAAHGVAWDPSALLDRVPMIDFAPRAVTPRVTRPAIYVDNSVCRSGQSDFTFDLDAMARAFPNHLLLCTRHQAVNAANVVDVSHLDLRDLSAVSEQCAVVLGKGSGPFCCTYTEPNRRRPRAVCGYRSETSPTFWDYPGNPLQYLDTMEAVLEFVAASLRRRTPEVLGCC